MFNSRYSEMEMQQWQEACSRVNPSNPTDANPMERRAAMASRQGSSRASMAKGQAEKKQSRTAGTTAQTTRQDYWASECLFDWYNG